METMDARRLELYDLLKPKLDEEPARKLVLALPADPEQLATKSDLAALQERLEHRMDARFAEMGERIARLEATLTRRMVMIMGAWSVILSSAWGAALAVFA